MSSDDIKPEDESDKDESYHFGSFKKLKFETVEVSASKNAWNTDYIIAGT